MLRSIVVAPFLRLLEAPLWSKMAASILTVLEFVSGAPLAQLLLLLSVTGGLDYMLGAEVARRDGRYDPNIARAGALGKASGVVLVLIVRCVEAILTGRLIDTGGALSFALCTVLLIVELESYDSHREQLTGKPTPLLRPILDALRAAAERLVPLPRRDR